MDTCCAFDHFPETGPAVVLTVGAFDGIHLGHQAIIRHALARARERGCASWIMTFDPHPSRVVRPASAPPLLTTREQRTRIFTGLGVDGCFFVPFDLAMAAWPPEEFVDRLHAALHGRLQHIVVGENWRFGHRTAGDVALLAERMAGHGVTVEPMKLVVEDGERVSSTRVRQTLRDGNVEEAAHLLGRPYAVCGTVAHGRKFGRELGFPTANVKPENEMLPAPGIYAVRVRMPDGTHCAGAGYLGGREEQAGVLEVHCLDPNREWDLYGRRLEVEFDARIREDREFESIEALKAQIAADVAAIRNRAPN